MTGAEHKVELPWIKSEYFITDNQILQASAFICKSDRKNPTEIIEMLGLADDLQEVRRIRRQRKHDTAS